MCNDRPPDPVATLPVPPPGSSARTLSISQRIVLRPDEPLKLGPRAIAVERTDQEDGRRALDGPRRRDRRPCRSASIANFTLADRPGPWYNDPLVGRAERTLGRPFWQVARVRATSDSPPGWMSPPLARSRSVSGPIAGPADSAGRDPVRRRTEGGAAEVTQISRLRSGDGFLLRSGRLWWRTRTAATSVVGRTLQDSSFQVAMVQVRYTT